MKKLITLLLAVSLISGLTSCGGESDGDKATTDETTVSDETTAADDTTALDTEETAESQTSTNGIYSVTLNNGITINLGDDAKEFTETATDYIDYMEAVSCVHEGYDKVYVFDGYSVSTAPNGIGGEFIYEFSLTSDIVSFAGGVTLGIDASTLDSVFGTEYDEQFGVRTYTLNDVRASVILEENTVIGITLTSNRY